MYKRQVEDEDEDEDEGADVVGVLLVGRPFSMFPNIVAAFCCPSAADSPCAPPPKNPATGDIGAFPVDVVLLLEVVPTGKLALNELA